MKDKFIINSENQEMFEVFCKLHPIEAFGLNKVKFCDFMRKEYGEIMDDATIEKLINETISESDE